MKPLDPQLQAFLDETLPDDDAVHALRQRLLSEVTDAASSHALLRHLPDPDNQAISRVRARLDANPNPQHRPRYGLWVAAIAGTTMLAATVMLAVGMGSWTGMNTEQALVSESDWQQQQLVPGVLARFRGTGSLTQTNPPDIHWTTGVLELEVDPTLGIELAIHTPEADIQVLGTVFSVTRDALGTQIHVARGLVGVECANGGASQVVANEHQTCLPTTAAGLLGRARALDEAAAPTQDVLDTIKAGLAIANGPIQDELNSFLIQLRLRSGEHRAALDLVEDYLASDTQLRRRQMVRVAAELSLTLHGCKRAKPYLKELEADPQSAKDTQLVRRCD